MSKKEVATSDATKTKRCWNLVPNWFWLFDTPAPWGGEDSFKVCYKNLHGAFAPFFLGAILYAF
jgi:hypothetical protein